MINPLVKNQLEKIKNINIDAISEYEYIISPSRPAKLEIEHYYIIKLKNYIINPPDNFTLSTNWNKGVVPKSEYLRCVIVQLLGDMVRICANGFDVVNNCDLNDSYVDLWLPKEGFDIIMEC